MRAKADIAATLNYRSRQLTAAPMVVFAIRIEHALDVPVQRPQCADQASRISWR